MTALAAAGDHVRDYGPAGGIVGLLAVGLWLYVVCGGRTGRRKP